MWNLRTGVGFDDLQALYNKTWPALHNNIKEGKKLFLSFLAACSVNTVLDIDWFTQYTCGWTENVHTCYILEARRLNGVLVGFSYIKYGSWNWKQMHW